MAWLSALTLWGHALAAFGFAALTLWSWRRPPTALPRWPLLLALATTACWALAIAGIGLGDPVTPLFETLRNLAWLGVMSTLHRRSHSAHERAAIAVVYGVVAIVSIAALLLTLAAETGAAFDPFVIGSALVLRMIVATACLVLVQSLYAGATSSNLRVLAVALGAMWLIDLNLVTFAYLAERWSSELAAVRGIIVAVIAIVIGVGALREERPLQVSRTVAMQSLTIAAIGAYCTVLALGTGALAAIGGSHARLLQTAFVFGSAAALLACLSAPWLRGWIKVKLAKHFFRHRYDYRAEWSRFTATLGNPGDGAALETRVIKAIADLTDSPGGLLLVADGPRLDHGASWHWHDDPPSTGSGDDGLADHLQRSNRIIELDAVRAEAAPAEDLLAVPQWMIDDSHAWVVVPLPHIDHLAGAIVLRRPALDRALDWEDFDLLKVAGRQVASYLAEARAHARLMEAQRFDEFNRRFAFILHDIKNLVSQLTLTARNAERYADNPAFRADMVATLTESAARMNELLARLSQRHRATRSDAARPTEVAPIAERVARACHQRHPVAVVSDGVAIAAADPAGLEQILSHLVGNAVDASDPSEPVTVAIVARADVVVIDVIDQGCGMSAAFIRDQLFRPFASSKPGGFGIGAYEARDLVLAMGGRIDVTSREGEGSRFRITLPAALAGRVGMDRAA
ncbi:XrtA/PEP-CTERM system histidine kinase PrsK [Sphingomonas japonica]|uniref:histidine kinase n=1 Tax=Sphingomonas japonica TaxID=511662 RepID=A0ABX0U3Y0_9SPHN|nr:XrtA/PEP-CTERM system histidine kinase PrsK [Sphingomonas japonica]NIJ24086.1 putative PEP-CTERM system histidine kinase [Sphingomonas japonica]